MAEENDRPEAVTRRRKSMRLRGYDYSARGAYFITICTHQRRPLFGQVADGNRMPTEFGHVVEEEWLRLPERFPFIQGDEFVVMPDHFHGILWIIDPEMGIPHDQDSSLDQDVEAGFTPAPDGQGQGRLTAGKMEGLPSTGQARGLPLLGHVIGAFKSL